MQLIPYSFGTLEAKIPILSSAHFTTDYKKSEYRVTTADDAGVSCRGIVAEKANGQSSILAVVPGIKWPLFNLIYKHTVASINISKCSCGYRFLSTLLLPEFLKVLLGLLLQVDL